MRGLMILAAALGLAGCHPPPAVPPAPRTSEAGPLIARARLVGIQYAAASKSLQCVPTRDAQPFMSLKARRELALADMAATNAQLLHVATTEAASIGVRLDRLPDSGCELALRWARQAMSMDPWAGQYVEIRPR